MSRKRDPGPDPTIGIRCPKCHCQHFSEVADTRPAPKNRIRRKRRCRNCSTEFVTFETVAFSPPDAPQQ